jgi:hypothetical protein
MAAIGAMANSAPSSHHASGVTSEATIVPLLASLPRPPELPREASSEYPSPPQHPCGTNDPVGNSQRVDFRLSMHSNGRGVCMVLPKTDYHDSLRQYSSMICSSAACFAGQWVHLNHSFDPSDSSVQDSDGRIEHPGLPKYDFYVAQKNVF